MIFLKRLLKKHSINNTIIIVFANYKYKLVLENWLIAISNIEIDNYLIISLDRKLHKYLKSRNVQSYYFKAGENLTDLWITRISLLKKILDMGYDFIHSDADAIWLKNPLKEYFYTQPCDIIFSQGTVWPSDIHEKWGFVLCCGLFCIKSNKSTRNLLNQIYINVRESRDDQVSFNRIIERDGVKWDVDVNYELPFRDKKIVCSERITYGITSNYRIALLPHSLFQRINENRDLVYVKHLISEKTSSGVVELLKQNGLLYINENDR